MVEIGKIDGALKKWRKNRNDEKTGDEKTGFYCTYFSTNMYIVPTYYYITLYYYIPNYMELDSTIFISNLQGFIFLSYF